MRSGGGEKGERWREVEVRKGQTMKRRRRRWWVWREERR